MKALVVGLILLLSVSTYAASAKKKVKVKKIENAKVTPTSGPCLTPTPKVVDPLKKAETKEEKPQGFSLQGGDTGCKLE